MYWNFVAIDGAINNQLEYFTDVTFSHLYATDQTKMANFESKSHTSPTSMYTSHARTVTLVCLHAHTPLPYTHCTHMLTVLKDQCQI
jgi:hypothetical protein